MQKRPDQTSFWRRPRYIPLQYRLILLSSGLVTLLLAITVAAVSVQQSRTIRNQVERRGFAIAHSLAATSKSALTTYTYITLSQTANQAGQDPDLAYVIIHDKEGRVAGYSGRKDLEGRFLEDEFSRKALAATEPIVQNALLEGSKTPVLEIAVPVTIPGSERSWGVVRVALSLDPLYRQIRQVQMTIGGIGVLALVLSVLVCIWLARRITNPVGLLVNATIAAARGNLNPDIRIRTGDEVEVLAENFSIMIREILLQRGQLERHLQEITTLQRYLNKLLTTMSDGLLSVDMEGTLITVNPSACVMLGIPVESVGRQEQKVEEFLQGAPELLRYVRNALKDRAAPGQQEIRVTLGEEVRNIIVASSFLTDKGEIPSQIIMNIHDVTELKKLESRFRQSERLAALGTLSAGMAHEIRNPLSAIKTFVQLLPRKLEKPGFLEKFHRTVPRELDRINRLIEDLLELARAPRYHFMPVDIRQMLQQSVELFEEDLILHRITCNIDLPAGLPKIWASPDQLTKAFNNLIQNAIQAMPEGGELVVHAIAGPSPEMSGLTSEGSGVVQSAWLKLMFADTGIGMNPEEMKSIFNPFFTTKDSGTGLGLAITHKVITEHGGQIEVESTLGKGTRFNIHLPVQEPGVSGEPVAPASS